MRIVSSQVALSAEQNRTSSVATQVSGRVWVGAEISQDNVRISDAARAQLTSASLDGTSLLAQGRILVSAAQSQRNAPSRRNLAPSTTPNPTEKSAAQTSSPEDTKTNDVDATSDEALLGTTNGTQLIVLKRLVEALTGKKVHLVNSKDLRATTSETASSDEAPAQPTNGEAPSPPPERAGWGVELDVERVHTETLSSSFEAQGSIVTADGKTLSFSASFLKSQESVSVERMSIREGDAKMKDPLVLVYSGTSAELSDQIAQFDLDNDGKLDQLAGVKNGAYVVFDRNRDGTVNDASELLGALSNDGFSDLRALDEDGNGFVDEGDKGYSQLYTWDPTAAPKTQLTSLASAGIGALYTGQVASPFDVRSDAGALQGRVRSTGMYLTENGTVRPMEQLDLAQPATPIDVKA
jgi:hypothetical protein